MNKSFIKSVFAFVAIIVIASTAFSTVQGYGSSSGTRAKKVTPAPLVLGAATTTVPFDCSGMYIKSYMRMSQTNDSADVLKLQVFLTAMGINTPATGNFDAATDASVRSFQVTHMSDILAPWGITNGTGYVYKTTRAKINNMVCPGSEPVPAV